MSTEIIDLGKIGLTLGGEWAEKVIYEKLTWVNRLGKGYISKKTNVDVKPEEDTTQANWLLVIDPKDAYDIVTTEGNYTGTREEFIEQLQDAIKGRYIVNGNVVNAADEEDLTSAPSDSQGIYALKLKDRDTSHGMGYVILRRHTPIANQMNKPNTIYEIRYDFDLNGQELTIPENCVLKFEGGSLSNGTLIANNTLINGFYCFNNNLDIKGIVKNIDINWYKDDFIALKRCLKLAEVNNQGLNITRNLNINYTETIETSTVIDFQNHILTLNVNNSDQATLILFKNTVEENVTSDMLSKINKNIIIKDTTELENWNDFENSLIIIDNKNYSEIKRTANVDYIKIHEFLYIDEYGNRYGDIWNNDIPLEGMTANVYKKITNQVGVKNCNLQIIKTDNYSADYRNIGFKFSHCVNAIFENNTIFSLNNNDFSDKEATLDFAYTYIATIKDCYIKNTTNKASNISSYGLSLGNIINLTIDNVKADGNYDNNVWGITGSNYLYNVNITNSQLNRIDTHWRCVNLNIDKCNIGIYGITYSGKGIMNIRDSHFTNVILNPRSDYGAFFDGEININNCYVHKHTSNVDLGIINIRLYSTPYNIRNYDRLYVGAKSINIKNLIINTTGNTKIHSIVSLVNIVHSSEQNISVTNNINVPNIYIDNVNLDVDKENSFYIYNQKGKNINVLNTQNIIVKNCKNIFQNAITDNIYKNKVCLINVDNIDYDKILRVYNSNICSGGENNKTKSTFINCNIESLKQNNPTEENVSEYTFIDCTFKYIKRTITTGRVFVNKLTNLPIICINCLFDVDDSYNPYLIFDLVRIKNSTYWSIFNYIPAIQMIGCRPSQKLVDVYNNHLNLSLQKNNFINIDKLTKGNYYTDENNILKEVNEDGTLTSKVTII